MKKNYSINRRKFLELFGCTCCGFFTSGCETVPLTDRKQLAIYPESVINRQAAKAYIDFKKKAKLVKKGDELTTVVNIGEKIASAVSVFFKKKQMPDPTTNFEWEYVL